MAKLFHIRYVRSTDESLSEKTANVSEQLLKRIKTIPWIILKEVKVCNRKVRENKILS